MIELYAYSSQCDLHISVSMYADLDSTFEAQCLDTGDILTIDGWMFTFEEV